MKITNIMAVAALFAVVGCETIKPEKETKIVHNKKLNTIKRFTQTSKKRIGIDIVNTDLDFSAVKSNIEGTVANMGYKVTSKNPFLVIYLNNKITTRDRLGNYFVMKGKSEMTVNKKLFDGTILARTTISKKGDRKLGIDDALSSLYEKIAVDAEIWIKRVCERELGNLVSENVVFDKEIFDDAFGQNWFTDDDKSVAIKVNEFIKTLAKRKNILSCVKVGENSSEVTIEFVYSQEEYPNGIALESIEFDDNVKSMDEFIRNVVK